MAMAFHTTGHSSARRGNRLYALILGALTTLFGLRVLGQAIQRWAPQPFLPSFDAFQGSNLPYWLVLTSQLGLIALMIGVASRVSWGALRRSPQLASAFGWAGAIYMTGSIGRIAAGLLVPEPPAWCTAWIPAFFHVVLAAFVLALAAYHRRKPAVAMEEVSQ